MTPPGTCPIGKDVILRTSDPSPHSAELETHNSQTSLFVSCWQDEVLNIFIYEARGCASSEMLRNISTASIIQLLLRWKTLLWQNNSNDGAKGHHRFIVSAHYNQLDENFKELKLGEQDLEKKRILMKLLK